MRCNASLDAFCAKQLARSRCACHPARLSSEAFLRYALYASTLCPSAGGLSLS